MATGNLKAVLQTVFRKTGIGWFVTHPTWTHLHNWLSRFTAGRLFLKGGGWIATKFIRNWRYSAIMMVITSAVAIYDWRGHAHPFGYSAFGYLGVLVSPFLWVGFTAGNYSRERKEIHERTPVLVSMWLSAAHWD